MSSRLFGPELLVYAGKSIAHGKGLRTWYIIRNNDVLVKHSPTQGVGERFGDAGSNTPSNLEAS